MGALKLTWAFAGLAVSAVRRITPTAAGAVANVAALRVGLIRISEVSFPIGVKLTLNI